MDWIASLTRWLLSLVKMIWNSFVDFLGDFWVGIADSVLSAVADTIASIPVPGFLDTYSLSAIFASFPSDILYFVSFMNLTSAFAVVGMGFTFRMTRKLITLFQW